MLSYLFDWCRNGVRFPVTIPDSTTHILKLKSNILTREYHSLNKFKTCTYQKLYIPYDKPNDRVYTDGLCQVKTVTLGEFMHLIVPGESFTIDYIPIETYDSLLDSPETTEVIDPKGYVCTCTDNTDTCVFHEFMIEKIYSKYQSLSESQNEIN